MPEPLKLLAVTAHPDDETLGLGGVMARYHAEGVETYLVVATRGERGWQGIPEENPGLGALGKIREEELCAAAKVLGLKEVNFLGYTDGDLDQAEPEEIIEKLSRHIRRIRPDVVITFPPDGAYGHPDHIAISQFTVGGVVHAANGTVDVDGLSPHKVDKTYFMAWDEDLIKLYESVFGKLVFEVDGVMRASVPWENWAVTTRIDTKDYWEIVNQAVACHRSQLESIPGLFELEREKNRELWGQYQFIRVFSLVNSGRQLEEDLFEGLR